MRGRRTRAGRQRQKVEPSAEAASWREGRCIDQGGHRRLGARRRESEYCDLQKKAQN